MADFPLNKVVSPLIVPKGTRSAKIMTHISNVSRAAVFLISKISSVLKLSGSARLAILVFFSRTARAPHTLVKRFRKL